MHIKKDYKTAFRKMKEALCDIDDISEEEKYQIANLYSDYARLYLDVGDVSGSIEKYKETIEKYGESESGKSLEIYYIYELCKCTCAK